MSESLKTEVMRSYESLAKFLIISKGVAENRVDAFFEEATIDKSRQLRLLEILKGDMRMVGDHKLNFVTQFEMFCGRVPGWSECFESILDLNKSNCKSIVMCSENQTFAPASVTFWLSLAGQGPYFNVRHMLALRAQKHGNCYLNAAVLLEHYLICLSSGLSDLRMVDLGLWERNIAIINAAELCEFLFRKYGSSKDALKQFLGLDYSGIKKMCCDNAIAFATIYEIIQKRPLLLSCMEIYPELLTKHKLSYSIADRDLGSVRLAHHSMVVIGARRDNGPNDGGYYFLCQTSWKSKFFIEFSAAYLHSCEAELIDVPDGETLSVRQAGLHAISFLCEYAESAIDIPEEGPVSLCNLN